MKNDFKNLKHTSNHRQVSDDKPKHQLTGNRCENTEWWRLRRDVRCPTRELIRDHLQHEKKSGLSIHGVSNCELGDLAKHRPVTFSLAQSLARMYQEKPGLFKGNQRYDLLPAPIFYSLFGKVPSDSAPNKYNQPTVGNDSAMRGLGWLGKALFSALDAVGKGKKATTPDARCTDLDDCITRIFTALGYYLAPEDRKLTPDLAYASGAAYTKDELELRQIVSKLQRINPDCVRYAMCDDRVVGLTVAFPITDKAYEETVAGKRHIFQYGDDDILPHGNNIVLYVYSEAVADTEKRTIASRYHMSISFMWQIALLLDTKSVKAPRYLSFSVGKTNTKRLISQGFELVTGTSAHPYIDCQAMKLERSRRNRPGQALVLDGVHALLLIIRRGADRKKKH